MNPRLAVLNRELGCSLCTATELGRNRENYRSIGIAHVPFGALRNIRARSFGQQVSGGNDSILCKASTRAPAGVRDAQGQREVQRRAIRSRLSARDNLLNHVANLVAYRLCPVNCAQYRTPWAWRNISGTSFCAPTKPSPNARPWRRGLSPGDI